MRYREVFRRGIKVAGILVAIVVALYLVCLIPNLHDQPLTATAHNLLTPPINPYSATENIYIAMAGINAPSHESALVAGSKRIEEYNHALDLNPGDMGALVKLADQSTVSNLKFSGDWHPWSPLTVSIWSLAKTRRSEVIALRNANQELFDRYCALLNMKGYFETARPTVMSPIVFAPISVRALFLADIATQLQTGTVQERRAAFTRLQKDLLLWKTVLEGQGGLLSKMLAAAALHGDLLLVGDFIADPQTDLTLLDGSLLVAPFKSSEWSIGNAFPVEMRFIDSTLQALPRASSADYAPDEKPKSCWLEFWNCIEVPFFKLRATANLEAESMERLHELADADPAEYAQASAAYANWRANAVRPAWFRRLYNPVGRTLFSIGSGAYENYIVRAYDVAAVQRLVCLAYQIRRQKVEGGEVPAFMTRHPEWATHPINNAPLVWDSRTATLAVETKGQQPSDRRFSLRLPMISRAPS